MGDDNNQTGGLNGDDENGVIFPALVPGESAVIPVVVTIADDGFQSSDPRLNAWIDWNGNGAFEAGERIVTNQTVLTSGTVNLSVAVPANAVTDRPTFARFRIGPSVTGPTGLASFGEVEDDQIQIGQLCVADVNASGEVDIIDVQLVSGAFNTNVPAYDFNQSGLVDVSDIQFVADRWLLGC